MFSKAIVKTPCRALVNGITTANLGEPDYHRALDQHSTYVDALQACGLEVVTLPADEAFPDSTFVEDAALVTPRCAIITRPGADSRRLETVAIRQALLDFFPDLESIEAPGTVDAGDIMMVGSHYFIGLSERTNRAGAEQVIDILGKYDLRGSVVELRDVLHLKTGISYLEDNHLLACGEFLQKPEFKSFNLLEVDENEAYAANSVWINGTVLIPAGHPKTESLIRSAGYDVRVVDVSEFQKLDGGLSCLSLRF